MREEKASPFFVFCSSDVRLLVLFVLLSGSTSSVFPLDMNGCPVSNPFCLLYSALLIIEAYFQVDFITILTHLSPQNVTCHPLNFSLNLRLLKPLLAIN